MKVLKWIRANGGQTVVARQLGVSISAVSRWVNGNRSPTASMIQKIITLSKGEVTFSDIMSLRKNSK